MGKGSAGNALPTGKLAVRKKGAAVGMLRKGA